MLRDFADDMAGRLPPRTLHCARRSNETLRVIEDWDGDGAIRLAAGVLQEWALMLGIRSSSRSTGWALTVFRSGAARPKAKDVGSSWLIFSQFLRLLHFAMRNGIGRQLNLQKGLVGHNNG